MGDFACVQDVYNALCQSKAYIVIRFWTHRYAPLKSHSMPPVSLNSIVINQHLISKIQNV